MNILNRYKLKIKKTKFYSKIWKMLKIANIKCKIK